MQTAVNIRTITPNTTITAMNTMFKSFGQSATIGIGSKYIKKINETISMVGFYQTR